jgi:catechol 2,3-dioxygenase-like lactoylglutathione lyase family enzyme
MHLGKLDICLRIEDVETSMRFYQGLGFEVVEGNASDGWAVLTNDQVRIGLFQPQFMSTEFSLNFRGANISKLIQELQCQGYSLEGVKTKIDGTGSAILRDPDGHMIFFDTNTQELNAE